MADSAPAVLCAEPERHDKIGLPEAEELPKNL
jgi:hypothetical protein